ncbi:hypothetical protein [Tateyamaria omphalii]|uniref:Chemotaxis protein MotC n=1 Tax=Tateyamaria omphalii TaxID=299262 RepID=A0A1P8N1T8_9RHOB|nr:hypothetical protein [Tateyamaria omphalii]APX14281.1 hypothetical protein BWR18_20750 [Tateyamaria omphalii]
MMRALAAFVFVLSLPLSTAAAQDLPRSNIPNVIAPAGLEAERVSVVVDRGLTSNKGLRSRALRVARDALHAGEPVAADQLRSLAEAGDGLAAQRYVRLLQAKKAQGTPSDIAYFSAIAVGTGRIWTLGAMIDAMHTLNPETEPKARVRKYIQVLYPHAWAGNRLAFEAVVDFNGAARLFGPLSERTRARILEEAQKQGDGRIELGMAMGLLERATDKDRASGSDLTDARALLQVAVQSKHLGVSTTAANLLQQTAPADGAHE